MLSGSHAYLPGAQPTRPPSKHPKCYPSQVKFPKHLSGCECCRWCSWSPLTPRHPGLRPGEQALASRPHSLESCLGAAASRPCAGGWACPWWTGCVCRCSRWSWRRAEVMLLEQTASPLFLAPLECISSVGDGPEQLSPFGGSFLSATPITWHLCKSRGSHGLHGREERKWRLPLECFHLKGTVPAVSHCLWLQTHPSGILQTTHLLCPLVPCSACQ